MAEWFKAQSWKDCLFERVTRVRIPISPYFNFRVKLTVSVLCSLFVPCFLVYLGGGEISENYINNGKAKVEKRVIVYKTGGESVKCCLSVYKR